MLQPKCCAAYKAQKVAHSLMKVEISVFMKAMQDASSLYLGAYDFSC